MEYRSISGADVLSLRKSLGLNQGEFAVRLNTDQSTVSKWERDEQRPNGTHALEIKRLIDQQSNKAKLTTHVLDTASGLPAAGLEITLYRLSGDAREKLKTVTTNDDGRCDAPLLAGAEFATGQYELVFAAGDYLRRLGVALPEPAFLEVVPIRFGMAEEKHYHVPLLISPYGYSTYRGS